MKKLLISLCCLFLLVGCGAQMPEEEIPVSADASLTRAGVVYGTDGTHLVPVRVTTVLGEDTPTQLAAQLKNPPLEGVSSVLPQDAELTVRTGDDGVAQVSVTGEVSQTDGEALVCAVVNTLTGCESISSVQFSVNGLSESLGAVDLSAPIDNSALNPAYSLGEHEAFQVFFRNENGQLVPVTKETNNPCAEVFLKAMMTVPEKYPTLTSLFPAGTALHSAVLTDGTLSLDFSSALYGLSATPAAEEKLFGAIAETCRQLEGVEQIAIYVDGVEYTACEPAQSVFAN